MRIPRLTIAQLAFGVGTAAIIFASLFVADSGLTWTLFAVYLLSLVTPFSRYSLPWFPSIIALAIVTLSASGLEPMSPAVALFFSLFSLILAISTVREGQKYRHVVLWVASLACIISVMLTAWPLRLAFLASRSDFEAFARRVEAGYQLAGPEKVGRFVIRRAEMRNGRPCLWTDTDPAGFTGFVRNPYSGVNVNAGRYSNTAFNLWSDVSLDADWAYIKED